MRYIIRIVLHYFCIHIAAYEDAFLFVISFIALGMTIRYLNIYLLYILCRSSTVHVLVAKQKSSYFIAVF